MIRPATAIAFILFTLVSAFAQTPEQLIKHGHWKRARAVVEPALAAKPSDPTLLRQMAQIKRAFGDLVGAQALAEKAVAAAGTAENHFQMARIYGEQAQKAGLFKQMSLARSMKKEMEAAIGADPKFVDAHYLQMVFFKEAPGIIGGGMDKARAEAAEIAKLDPAWGYIALAELALKDKREADMPELYRKAHDANPTQYDTAFQWCNSLAGQKKWAEAEKCSRDLLTVEPTRTPAYSILVFTYVNQLRWDEADKVLADAEKAIPDNLAPYFAAGTASTTVGAYDRSERYLRKYMSQEPEPTGQKISRAHWRLGLAFEKAGRKNDAVNEVRIAAEMEPTFEPAQKDMKRLK